MATARIKPTPITPPTFIDLLTVKAGKQSGIFLEGEVRGEAVYMPLTAAGARPIAADRERAVAAIEALTPEAAVPLH